MLSVLTGAQCVDAPNFPSFIFCWVRTFVESALWLSPHFCWVRIFLSAHFFERAFFWVRIFLSAHFRWVRAFVWCSVCWRSKLSLVYISEKLAVWRGLLQRQSFVRPWGLEEASHYKRGKLSMYMTKPRRVRRNKRKCKICATRSRKRASPQVRSPIKNFMNRCARLASISVVILIRTDTTLDHSQKAEKVWAVEQRRKFRHARLQRGKVPWKWFSMGQSPPKNW